MHIFRNTGDLVHIIYKTTIQGDLVYIYFT